MDHSFKAGRNVTVTVTLAGGQFLKEQNLELPYNPGIAFLGTYHLEIEIYSHTKTCT